MSEEPRETPQDPFLPTEKEMPLSRVSSSPTKNSQTSTSQEPRETPQDSFLPTEKEMPLSHVSTSPTKNSQTSTSQEPRETPQDPFFQMPHSRVSTFPTKNSLASMSQEPRENPQDRFLPTETGKPLSRVSTSPTMNSQGSFYVNNFNVPFRFGLHGVGTNAQNTNPASFKSVPTTSSSLPQRLVPSQQPRNDWNPKMWEWDSQRFEAKPVDAESLPLGNSGINAVEDTPDKVSPNKKVRSGSPGNGDGNYPKCQVDNCKKDLSLGNVDNYRKCKVCEVHYKAISALVEKRIQRFCQYCQRFHLLSEFNGGNRICRRGASEFYPSTGAERTSNSKHSPSQDSDTRAQDTRYSLSQELSTSSPEVESRPTVASSTKYYSSTSCNPVDDNLRAVQGQVKQDLTRQIVFKLFGTDPSQLPRTLRTEIYNWLSSMPSEVESYIRPGCVILSVYVAMSASAWEQLEENLLQRVSSLVQDSEFWSNTSFLVNTGRQLASYKHGRIRISKSWRTSNSPKLITVSPLAVVAGEETTLVVRGRNLTTDGMSLRCAHMGKYALMEVTGAEHRRTKFDELNVRSFKVESASPGSLGRCFIQVENGFRCDSFPLIIANAEICKELNHLEDEFNRKDVTEEHTDNSDRPRSREEVLYFLNELGWLFQRIRTSEFSLLRFKYLLVCSVERGYCALIKTLMDMMVERNLGEDGLNKESLDMLAEIQLLNCAVKRRDTKMVETLIHYSINPSTKNFIVLPNTAGPGDIIPLHLAPSTSESDDMIDVVTNDPNKIGLSCRNSLIDASYAAMINNHSYNTLVARKVADWSE